MPEYTLDEAREAAADLEDEIGTLRARDPSGRFVAEPEPPDPLAEALASMRSREDAGLRRIGLRTELPPPKTPKGHGDFGGGNRGTTPPPAPPGMDDVLKALIRRQRDY